MNDYICLKAVTLTGKNYSQRDVIPYEAVLPSRERALIKNKIIAPLTAAGLGERGIVIAVDELNDSQLETLQTGIRAAIAIMGKNLPEATAAINETEDLFILECVLMLDERKGAKDAVEARKKELMTTEEPEPDPEPEGGEGGEGGEG